MSTHSSGKVRRSIRLPGYDYAETGAYFVTLVTHGRVPIFGTILNAGVCLSEFGRIVEDEWLRSPQIRRELVLDTFVVMPNHLHGIVLLKGGEWETNVGATGRSPLRRFAADGPGMRTLGSFVGGFKAASTSRINTLRSASGTPVWQRNFYERVVRNDCELELAREYVLANPAKWAEDINNPAKSGGARVLPVRSVGATNR